MSTHLVERVALVLPPQAVEVTGYDHWNLSRWRHQDTWCPMRQGQPLLLMRVVVHLQMVLWQVVALLLLCAVPMVLHLLRHVLILWWLLHSLPSSMCLLPCLLSSLCPLPPHTPGVAVSVVDHSSTQGICLGHLDVWVLGVKPQVSAAGQQGLTI
jgi:hypothetical protein